jgi:hypothetical protein
VTQTAAERLEVVLAEENAALKRMDFPAAVALVPAKEAALRELTPDRASAAIAPRLGLLAAENKELLDRAIVVQMRIIRLITQALPQAKGSKRYTAQGSFIAPARAPAMTLSARI